jgi:SAM-dependent methyltransferase
VEQVVDTPLGTLRIAHPPGTFAPTPATGVMVRAISGGRGGARGRVGALAGSQGGSQAGSHAGLRGQGLDWGSGTGILALAAALRADVESVVGLDISAANVRAARSNARANGLDHKARFFEADDYRAHDEDGRRALAELQGRAGFVTANPPASEGDDGFTFRYAVLRGARDFLAPGGVVLMQALSAYGPERVERLVEAVPGFAYQGVVEATSPAPLGLERADLRRNLDDYAAEEARGGLAYHFHDASGRAMAATEALELYRATGEAPLARWQVHRFERVEPAAAR